MTSYPFTAVVGADDMALALLLTAIAPEVGGVLVRGEKGTAKSTIVRALVEVLPAQQVVSGCRFGCDPANPDPGCPDGPHAQPLPSGSHDGRSTHSDSRDAGPAGVPESSRTRPAQLVELPVGASEDRVVGSLDLGRALGDGVATFEPGLLASAHRGLLYVDEVNLLHDHLVDLLLDAAAMGRNSVERDGVSFSHAARFVLVGTMNPEEGELRPQLLDRFGLTVEVAASRDAVQRAEIVRRRLAFDADPTAFAARFADAQDDLAEQIRAARLRLPGVRLGDGALQSIARVCAGFDVDGLRADIVTARAARAHAAWQGRDEVTRQDIRAAARLALPHRRRRKPFDAPGLDERLLDELLDAEPDPPPPDDPGPDDPGPDAGPDNPEPDNPGPDDSGSERPEPESGPEPKTQPGSQADGASRPATQSGPPAHHEADATQADAGDEPDAVGPGSTDERVSTAADPYRTLTLRATGVGRGAAGRRSRALTSAGRTVGAVRPRGDRPVRLHLPATIAAAARRQALDQHASLGRMRFARDDLRESVLEGPESNLVLFCVDASGSMAARQRMSAVKTAVLSLLMDAYQRRDRVGVVTFRGTSAQVSLPPTWSVEAAARCLAAMPHGGRTPLAEGLERTAALLDVERVRDRHQRPLVVVLTDGRATAGRDALARARAVAAHWPHGGSTIVVDCENGRFRMGLAVELAAAMGARHLPLADVDARALVDAVHDGTRPPSSRGSDPRRTTSGPRVPAALPSAGQPPDAHRNPTASPGRGTRYPRRVA
ncbi:MAG: VWA domain-containing protein [Actinomycetales bacterium]